MSIYDQVIREKFENCLDNSMNAWSGCYQGIETIISHLNNNTLDITILAKSDTDQDNMNLLDKLIEIQGYDRKLITSVSATSRIAHITIPAKNAKKVASALDLVMPIYDFLSFNGYYSTCQSCGNVDEECNYYLFNNSFLYLCPTCARDLENRLADRKRELSRQSSNLFLGIVGALIGGAIGILIHCLIYNVGFIMFFSGMIIGALALVGYEKLGGTLDKKGTIALIILVPILLYLANHFAWTSSIYFQLYKDAGWSFSEVFNDLLRILKYHDVTASYIKELLIVLIIGMITSISSIISKHKISQGDFSFSQIKNIEKRK